MEDFMKAMEDYHTPTHAPSPSQTQEHPSHTQGRKSDKIIDGIPI